MPRARHTLLTTAVAAVTFIPLAARADEPALGVIADGGTPKNSKESNQGVYVRDSAVAAEKLALGERMERLKEWDKAADIFQEILEKYPDRVVQSTASGKANQYSSVAVAVQQRLAKWPAEGLRAYRNRYESTAAEMLTGAGRDDYATLNTVYQRYFVTDAGKAAGLRMIDLYLESGEFPAAAWLGDRLLQWHPTIQPERPRVLYRVAAAYHLAGDKEKASARLDELKNTAPDATGTVRGQDVNLAESLTKDLASSVAIAQNQSADSWPMLMGDATRGRLSTGLGRAGARPFSSIELIRPTMAGLPQEAQTEWKTIDNQDQNKGLNIGIIPSVDRGEMFFQDGARLYAVSLDSGSALPGWAATYAGTGQYNAGAIASPLARRQQYTVTVTDKEVLAVMGQTGRTITFPGQPAAPQGETRLVCLDRATGAKKWSMTARDFPDQGNVRSLELAGSPLVVGDNVYVCGTGGKSAQFDDCYVFCLDRATGNHKWSAYVCSAATGQVLWGGDTGPVNDVVASVSYASGRLYVLTNLGAVAALDAYSGSVVWLDTYERDTADDPRMMMRLGQSTAGQVTKPWSYNPAVVSGGRVFALPSDGKYLSVYDAGSGDLLKRINLADVDNADTLIGIQGNKLVVSSDAKVYAFNWEAYDPANFTPRSGAIYWASPLGKSPVRGRGFMTGDSVFIPTQERLYRIGLASGKIEDPYPPLSRGPWEDPEGPGNVIVTEDKVILAGANRVSVYTDLAVARAKLDKEVAAAPKDPDLRLRYADMLFVAGDLKTAMSKLEEAIELLGGAKNLTPGPSRDRAFHTALTFAQKLSDPKVYLPENKETVNRLFDQAAAAATSPSQQVEYRVTRAHFAHDAGGDSATEVKLYQEILADEAMRTVPLGDPAGNSSQQAATVAEAAIAVQIRQAGAQVYAPYEKAAQEAMESARAAGQPDELLVIARQFPNATVAAQSMLLAADAYEAKGEPRRATQVLRQLYFKYPQASKETVLESMARNYLSIPGAAEVAASRLAAGARLAGETKLSRPLVLPDGKKLENVTLAQAAEALRQVQAAGAARALPEFKLPQGKPRVKPFVPAETADGVKEIVSPLQEFSRLDRAVTFLADDQVAVFAPGKAQPLWRSKSLENAPRQCAWIGANLAVWNQQEVALLAGDNGSVLWRMATRTLPEIQVVRNDDAAATPPPDAGAQDQGITVINGRRVRVRAIQWGMPILANAAPVPAPAPAGVGGEQITQVRPAGDKLIASTSTGRLFAVDLADGRLSWQTRLTTDHPIERLLATDDFAVARFTDGITIQIIALDAATGQVIQRYDNFRVDGNTLPVNQTLAPDGTLILAFSDHLMAKDLYEPGAASKWETPAPSGAAQPFIGAESPDQLVAASGRLLAVSDAGSFVRLLSLETGQPITAKGDSGDVPVQLPTSAKLNTPAHLRVSGSCLYVFGPQSLKAFDLDNPLDTSGQRTLPENANLRDVVLGSDYVIAIDEPGVARFIGNPDAPAAAARLLAYSRARVNGRESGRLDFDPTFPEPAGILSWQPVSGGFFYLTADNKLHFLKANNP